MSIDSSAQQAQQLIAVAQQAIMDEAHEVSELKHLIDHNFVNFCQLLLGTKGRVVVLGMGKSGHIGGKIAATLASTGTPAFFVHPAEASHGDLGMITEQDTTLLLSYSGETDELLAIIPALKHLQVPILAITGKASSSIARHANAALTLNISKEACPLNLAPTSSSTATLALGDAIAIALLHARGFDQQHFAKVHPGGSLGKQLLLTVAEVMRCPPHIPCVNAQASLAETMLEASNKGLGMCCIIDDAQHITGIFTDGDLRRSLQQKQLNTQIPIIEIMTQQAITTTADKLAIDAVNTMQQHQITALPVVDQRHKIIGVLHMHDLLKAKII